MNNDLHEKQKESCTHIYVNCAKSLLLETSFYVCDSIDMNHAIGVIIPYKRIIIHWHLGEGLCTHRHLLSRNTIESAKPRPLWSTQKSKAHARMEQDTPLPPTQQAQKNTMFLILSLPSYSKIQLHGIKTRKQFLQLSRASKEISYCT